MLWPLCAIVAENSFGLQVLEASTEADTGRLGRAPSFPAAFPGPDSVWFCHIQLRQNAQGKGRAEGSILKQDKGRASQVTPARVTSPRSAGRFKGFRALEGVRMWGSHLSFGALFGV